MKNPNTTGLFTTIVAVLLVVTGVGTANAHEAKCPYCELEVVQDTPEQDNETAIQYGKKRIEYRCVFCALADAEKTYSDDVTILAPSEIKGKPISITRTGGVWSAPDSTVFVGKKVKHRHCQTGYRAFTTKVAFDAHVAENKVLLKEAKPITLVEMVAIAKADAGKKK